MRAYRAPTATVGCSSTVPPLVTDTSALAAMVFRNVRRSATSPRTSRRPARARSTRRGDSPVTASRRRTRQSLVRNHSVMPGRQPTAQLQGTGRPYAIGDSLIVTQLASPHVQRCERGVTSRARPGGDRNLYVLDERAPQRFPLGAGRSSGRFFRPASDSSRPHHQVVALPAAALVSPFPARQMALIPPNERLRRGRWYRRWVTRSSTTPLFMGADGTAAERARASDTLAARPPYQPVHIRLVSLGAICGPCCGTEADFPHLAQDLPRAPRRTPRKAHSEGFRLKACVSS